MKKISILIKCKKQKQKATQGNWQKCNDLKWKENLKSLKRQRILLVLDDILDVYYNQPTTH